MVVRVATCPFSTWTNACSPSPTGSTSVYSPLVDAKFPENVDLTIVEGAVSSEEDLHKIRLVRSRTKLLMALGDCAVTSNVPGMRNYFSRDDLLRRAYVENVTMNPGVPTQVIPRLLPKSKPVHEYVMVDIFVAWLPARIWNTTSASG